MGIRYVTSEGVSLAYQIVGAGEPTLLHIPGAVSNLALENSTPEMQAWYGDLSRFGRVIRFDKRGTGLSDRSVRPTTMEQQLPDIEAIREATATDRAILWGLSQGAPLAALYTVAYPEHVTRLILVEGVTCDARDPYLPLSDTNLLYDWEQSLEAMERNFAAWVNAFADLVAPGATPESRDLVVAFLQATASPAAYKTIWRGLMGFDIRPLLRRIDVPTLVVHATGDRLYSVQHGRYLAEHIAGARLLELETDAHVPWMDETVRPELLAAVEEFITGSVTEPVRDRSGAPTQDRVIVTVLFTDIVNSSAQQRAAGDAAWRTTRTAFETNTQRIVEHHRGRVVQFTGDGVMAVFPSPGDGLRAAQALRVDARALGVDIRAGLNTGEAYEAGDQLHGVCVTIAARVAAQAGAGEILTTEVVGALVEGGDFTFTAHSEVELKGIGPRRLVRLT